MAQFLATHLFQIKAVVGAEGYTKTLTHFTSDLAARQTMPHARSTGDNNEPTDEQYKKAEALVDSGVCNFYEAHRLVA